MASPSDFAALPAQPLPSHLQNAVFRALSDLQAQRLLYPHQCAAAEAEGQGARAEAKRSALASLGGVYDYAAAKAELEQACHAAKALACQRRSRRAEGHGMAAPGAAKRPAAAPVPEATSGGGSQGQEGELWGSWEAFSAAVAAEVDQRIATARLHTQGPKFCQRLHRQQQEQPQPRCATEAAPSPGREPLGSLQRSGQAPQQAPASAVRKRERSPHTASLREPAAAERAAAGERCEAQKRRAAVAPQLPQLAPPAGSPASKRQRPHVVFGSRCDAPRSVGSRGLKHVRLEAAIAPMPPQLPTARPAAVGLARKVPAAGMVAGTVASATPQSTQPDLLRSLGAAFAGGGGSELLGKLEAQALLGAAVWAGPAHTDSCGTGSSSCQLQRMLSDLSAALRGLQPASASGNGQGSTRGPSSSVQAVLQQHGITATEMQDASSLLTVVLDRMDAISLRASKPPPPALADGSVSAPAPPPAVVAAPSSLTAPLPAAVANTSQADALCPKFSHLLHSSGAQMQEIHAGLAAAQSAEAAVQRKEATAVEAALAGTEAAAKHASGIRPAAAQDWEGIALSESTLATVPAAGVPKAGSGTGAGFKAAAAAAAQAAHRWHEVHVQPSPLRTSSWLKAAATSGMNSAELAATACTPAHPLPEEQQLEGSGGQPPESAAASVAHAEDTEVPYKQADVPGGAPSSVTGWPAPCEQPEGAATVVWWPATWAPSSNLLLMQRQPVAAALSIPAMCPGQAYSANPSQPPAILLPVVPAPAQQQAPAAGEPSMGLQERQFKEYQQWESEGASHSAGSDADVPDEQPDRPASDSSSASEIGSGTAAASSPLLGAQATEVQEQEGEWEAHCQVDQSLLDEMVALAIEQRQQHSFDDDAQQAVKEAAWDVAMRAMWPGMPAGDAWVAAGASSTAGGDAPEHGACTATTVAATPGDAASCGIADAEAASSLSPEQGLAVPLPAAFGVPRPTQPYNPIEAAAEARRVQDAAGWRQLRERADALVLWQEYASELGISLGEDALEQQPGEWLEAPDPAAEQLSPAAQLSPPAGLPEAAQPALPLTEPATVAADSVAGHPQQQRRRRPGPSQRLWRPGVPGEAAAEPAVLATPPPPPSAWSGETVAAAGSGTTITCPSSGGSDSLLSESSSGGASTGVAGRHKARALRYRLLRHQLAAAVGLQKLPGTDAASSLAGLTCSASDSEWSGSSPLSTAASAELPPRVHHGWQQQSQQPRPTAVVVGVPARGLAAAPTCRWPMEPQQAGEEGHLQQATVDDFEEQGPLPAMPTAVSQAAAAAEAAAAGICLVPAAPAVAKLDSSMTPALLSNLADHLSDGTPFEASVAAGWEVQPTERTRWRLHAAGTSSISSISTLGELGGSSLIRPLALQREGVQRSRLQQHSVACIEDGPEAELAATLARCTARLAASRTGEQAIGTASPASAIHKHGAEGEESTIHISALETTVSSSPASGQCHMTVSSSRGLAALRALKERLAAGQRQLGGPDGSDGGTAVQGRQWWPL